MVSKLHGKHCFSSFFVVSLSAGISDDYWGDFDYCDSIAIVGSTIAIVVILLRYYCDSCDTIAIAVILLWY